MVAGGGLRTHPSRRVEREREAANAWIMLCVLLEGFVRFVFRIVAGGSELNFFLTKGGRTAHQRILEDSPSHD